MVWNVTVELPFVLYNGCNRVRGTDPVTGRGSSLLLRGWLSEMVSYLVCFFGAGTNPRR